METLKSILFYFVLGAGIILFYCLIIFIVWYFVEKSIKKFENIRDYYIMYCIRSKYPKWKDAIRNNKIMSDDMKKKENEAEEFARLVDKRKNKKD